MYNYHSDFTRYFTHLKCINSNIFETFETTLSE